MNDSNPVEADVLSPEEMEDLAKPGMRRRMKLIMWALLCLAVTAIVVGVTVSQTTGSESITFAPTASPSSTPTLSFESRELFLRELIIRKTSPGGNATALTMPSTPQHKAFEWLIDEGELLDSETRILQRYILAVTYFALSGPQWSRKHTFLNVTNECLWMDEGITCDELGIISELDMCKCSGRKEMHGHSF